MDTRKVLIIVDNLGGGGAQKQIYLFTKYFRSNKFDVSILTYHQYSSDVYGGKIQELGIKVTTLNLPGYFKRIAKVRAFIVREKPGVVLSFLSGASILSSLVRISIPFLSFKLYVTERHGLTHIYNRRDRLKYHLYSIAANKVLVNSIDIKNKIEERAPFLKNKTLLIWNMVEKPEIPNALYEKSNKPKFKIVVGASYQRLKNADNFIHAVGTFVQQHNLSSKDITIEWFGNKMKNVNQAYLSELESLITAYHLENTFFLKDFTDSFQRELYKADFVALPSVFEGCPNVIIEAMYLEKPVLVSDVCSNSFIVGNKGGFLFDPYNVENIVVALRDAFYTLPEQRAEMGKINHQRAAELFSIEDKISQFQDVLSS